MLLPHWPIIETPEDKTNGQPASLGSMIHYMDRLCGRIVKEVDRLGIADNTFIIFMGDITSHRDRSASRAPFKLWKPFSQ
jgi:arylsulfatase A